jgi:hypothetical protein
MSKTYLKERKKWIGGKRQHPRFPFSNNADARRSAWSVDCAHRHRSRALFIVVVVGHDRRKRRGNGYRTITATERRNTESAESGVTSTFKGLCGPHFVFKGPANKCCDCVHPFVFADESHYVLGFLYLFFLFNSRPLSSMGYRLLAFLECLASFVQLFAARIYTAHASTIICQISM